MEIQEYYIDDWIKNLSNLTLKEIEKLGATIISVHLQEEDEEGELQDRFVDIKKGHELWN